MFMIINMCDVTHRAANSSYTCRYIGDPLIMDLPDIQLGLKQSSGYNMILTLEVSTTQMASTL